MKVYALVRRTGKVIGVYSSEDRAREAFTRWFESLRATKEGYFDKERPKALQTMSFTDMKVTPIEVDSNGILEEYLGR